MDLYNQLIRDEGKRLKMYPDSKGIMTIGIGHNLEAKAISERACKLIFEDDVADAKRDLAKFLPWTANLDEARLGVLINMTFNMGVAGLLKFKNTLALIQAGKYVEASKAMLESLWAKQVGDRADRLSEQMKTGIWQ